MVRNITKHVQYHLPSKKKQKIILVQISIHLDQIIKGQMYRWKHKKTSPTSPTSQDTTMKYNTLTI